METNTKNGLIVTGVVALVIVVAYFGYKNFFGDDSDSNTSSTSTGSTSTPKTPTTTPAATSVKVGAKVFTNGKDVTLFSAPNGYSTSAVRVVKNTPTAFGIYKSSPSAGWWYITTGNPLTGQFQDVYVKTTDVKLTA